MQSRSCPQTGLLSSAMPAPVAFGKDDVQQSISDRFSQIVAVFPDRLALKSVDDAITYKALDHAASRIAGTILLSRGIGSEPIALLFENGINAIVAMLGVLKAGKFFVVIDPSFPRERIRYIFNDSEAAIVITEARHYGIATAITGSDSTVMNVGSLNVPQAEHPLDVQTQPTDLAALMYTSGSTGIAKGIIETHRHGLDNARLNTEAARVVPWDRISLLHSLSFSAAKFSLHTAILNGACLCPFDFKAKSIEELVAWLVVQAITVLHCPPALFRQLAKGLANVDHHLRLLLLTGAPIARDDFVLYQQNFSRQTLLGVGMGSTETGQICTAVVDHDFDFPDEGSPAGYPYEGRRILLLDDRGDEAAPGRAGEIVVQGPHLTEGYWRNEELTKARFLRDAAAGGEQIYLTGDMGRMTSDGFLIHLGRKDLITKVRGYRVSLIEIERAIMEYAGVREVAVVERQNESAEPFLVAYLVVDVAIHLTHSDLRGFLALKIPEYMIPSVSVFLDEMPRSNGKIDRASLPAPDRTRPLLARPWVGANSECEKILLEIWEEVLDVRPIGIEDHFLDLGGHSLAATRIVSRLIQRLRLDLPLSALFQATTIAEMAKMITLHQRQTAGAKEINQILTKIESLTEDEARHILARRERSER